MTIARPLEERFWEKVDVRGADECWPWMGVQSQGYARIWVKGGQTTACRVSWELHFGPLPPRVAVKHTCDNTMCVNPEHLFVPADRPDWMPAVIAERKAMGLLNKVGVPRKEFCSRGHLQDGPNVRIGPTGIRMCRECDAQRRRDKRARGQ